MRRPTVHTGFSSGRLSGHCMGSRHRRRTRTWQRRSHQDLSSRINAEEGVTWQTTAQAWAARRTPWADQRHGASMAPNLYVRNDRYAHVNKLASNRQGRRQQLHADLVPPQPRLVPRDQRLAFEAGPHRRRPQSGLLQLPQVQTILLFVEMHRRWRGIMKAPRILERSAEIFDGSTIGPGPRKRCRPCQLLGSFRHVLLFHVRHPVSGLVADPFSHGGKNVALVMRPR